MCYVTNYISCLFTLITIAAVYENTAPSWLILVLLFAAGVFQVIASGLTVAKHNELEEHIKKLENKEEKNDGKTN